ncbi:MAG: DUF2207 domain-containing protein [Candidatus ainarchaeum sp.]|nr:DUF2207 domain-containing protein [Candidatus ainarchaeum sp.]MDD3976189.1 DUF2207 domain-containing protein [Candidatus ainarchaeum sp.]
MNKKSIFLIITIIFTLALILPQVSAKYYSIENYNITYNIQENTQIIVNEAITYYLNGSFTELYIQKPDDIIISEYNGYIEKDKNAEFIFKNKNESISGEKELILKGNFSNEQITAYFEYTIENAILDINDSHQFFYKIYGEKTNKSTKTNIQIILPEDINNTTYFMHVFNKDNYKIEESKNILSISKNVKSNEYIEINMLIPNTYFTQKSNYKKEYTSKDVLKIENKLKKKLNIGLFVLEHKKIYLLIYTLIGFIGFYLIWRFFGKEYSKKEVNYFGEYERDLPSKHDPIQANYFANGRFTKYWFGSIIMDLVNQKYLNFEKDKNDDLILIKTNKKIDILNSAYKSLYNYITKKMINNRYNLTKNKFNLVMDLEFKKVQKEIFEYYKNWKTEQELFEKKGNIYFSLLFFGYIAIYIIFISLIFSKTNLIAPEIAYMTIPMIYIFIISIYLKIFTTFQKLVYKDRSTFLSNRFTKKNRVLNLKWMNFNRYITDFSQIKKYPPRHVILWEKYIVYATAFGSAKKVNKIIKAHNLNVSSNTTNMMFLATYTTSITYTSLSNGSISGSGSSGSAGGFGGGMGGGGAGAR